MKIFILLFSIVVFFNTNLYSQNKAQLLLDKYKDSIKTYSVSVLVNNKGHKDFAFVGQKFKDTIIDATFNFGIGSCTKMFTSALILSSIQEKKLSLSDKINKFSFYNKIKNLPDSITIKNLLNHSSGIKDYITPQLLNSSLKNPYGNDFSEKYILEASDSLIFLTNSKHEYSNSNYYILRLILEEVEDKSYETLLSEKILNTHKLINTYPYYSKYIEKLAPPMFGPMTLDYIYKKPYNDLTKGVGNIVSNVEDLDVFLRLLLKEKNIINENLISEMLLFDLQDNQFGLGIMQYFNDKEMRVIGHSGRGLSYTSFVYYSPENDISVIVLTNDVNDIHGIKIYKELFNIYK